jgi:hypothetical protein
MRNWGFIDIADNAELEKLATNFSRKMKSVKTQSAVENLVRCFMGAYLCIGDDPTDTVIRDSVWVFLKRETRGKVSHAVLNRIWEESVASKHARCAIC